MCGYPPMLRKKRQRMRAKRIVPTVQTGYWSIQLARLDTLFYQLRKVHIACFLSYKCGWSEIELRNELNIRQIS